MKKTKVLYWIFTSLFAVLMLGSAIPDIISAPIAVEGFRQMNMPAYLLPFLGVAKVLGVVAILIPGYPRIKEWAYAGLVFDLIGATYSIIAAGQPANSWAGMALPLVLAAGSYIFYHKKLKATTLADRTSAKVKSTTGANAEVKGNDRDRITAPVAI